MSAITVTGFTAERMLAIEAGTVVDGEVIGDDLILTRHDGTTIDAGDVRGPQGIQGIQGNQGNALNAWPVGSIFLSAVSTNPNTLLGGGTWQAFGTGRVLVGIDPAQTEFAANGQTGGEKTHTLSTAEIPSHQHTVAVGIGGPASTAGGRASGDHNTGTGVQVDTFNTGLKGDGGAHNNLQPYITCYMWRRTA